MTEISKLLDRPIAFHPIFAEITGDVLAGLMLSQAIYWSTRTSDPDGWFYKTQKEWQKETCMSRSNQDTARRILRKHGWWQENLTGIPAKLHYRIDHTLLSKTMLTHCNKIAEIPQTEESKQSPQFAGIKQTGLQDSANTVCRNAANITEITQRLPETTLGDVHTPQPPSESFESKEPLSLLAKLKVVPVQNEPAQGKRTDCRSDINGMCVNHPYTLEGCTEPGKLYRLQAEKDWHASMATVRDGVSDAPHPLNAPSPTVPVPTPVQQQATVTAGAQNGQLRVLSPTSKSTGITASIEAVDLPSTPVSAKKRPVSRKAEKQDSPEEMQRKADHRSLMDYLQIKTGQKIINGAAQAGALKRILSGFTAVQAQEVLDHQLAGNWRGPVSWLSVQTQIADYFRRKEQSQSQTKLGGLNTNGKSKLWEYCNGQQLVGR